MRLGESDRIALVVFLGIFLSQASISIVSYGPQALGIVVAVIGMVIFITGVTVALRRVK